MESKKSKPAISIIVPIYNMEKLMHKCIDSILAQTFTDFECLLIDDGSTDGSSTICDEYAQIDSRVKVFHKPNGGLSDARNYGLERAQGEYTIFADPDDWVDAEGLDQLYQKAIETNADMVICDAYSNDAYHQSYVKQEPSSLNHFEVIKDLLTRINGYTWNKLIRRALYERYQIKYPIGMYGCEDQYTICKLLKNDIKVEYIPIAYYHYMHYDKDSLSKHYDETTYQHDIKIRDMFVDILKDDSEQKELAWVAKSRYMVIRAFKYGQKCFSNKQFQITFHSYRELIRFSKIPNKERILAYLSCFGGFHFWNWLFWKGFQAKQALKKIKWNLKR